MMTEKCAVEPADLFRLKSIVETYLSPDGNKILYCLMHGDLEKNESHSALWLLELNSGENRQFTSGKTMDYNASWSPDGSRIAFLSTRGGGAPQVYLIPVDGGEACVLTSLKQGVGGPPRWSPDGSLIAFTAGPSDPCDPDKPYRVTRHNYRLDGVGYADRVRQDIYLIPTVGGEVRQLTKGPYDYSDPLWSPDGQELMVKVAMKPDSHNPSSSLKLIDLQGNERELVSFEWGSVRAAAWMPDNQGIAFIGRPALNIASSKSDLWIIPRHSGKPECRTPGLMVGLGGGLQPDFLIDLSSTFFIDKGGNNAFAQIQEGGEIGIYRVALRDDESWERVVGGERACPPKGLSKEHLIFLATSLDEPGDIYSCRLDGSEEKRLTWINKPLISLWNKLDTEHIFFKGALDEKVEGWFIRPTNNSPAPYPTLVAVHGGPKSGWGNVFSFDFQMLTSAGFAILLLNYHGGSGYGSEFQASIRGKPGELEFADMMAGVDAVIEKGLADPQHLGVYGISYGGFMSCYAVTHTDRFKAAVPENPVSNWITAHWLSDMGPWTDIEDLGGHPFEIPEVYRLASPINFIKDCTTPTLLLQGESDYRCPAADAEQFYAGLKAVGCVVEMMRFPHGSHTASIAGTPVIRHAQNEALLDWMNRFVLGKTK
jgi:dipeptidyl aminopeptidase/acylaminoacyl peptidase